MPSPNLTNIKIERSSISSSSDGEYRAESQLLLHDVGYAPRGRRAIWSWLLHLLLLSISGAFFVITLYGSRQEHRNEYYPLMGHFPRTETLRFHGTFNRLSPFKGPPSKAVDEAWDRIAPLAVMRIPEKVFQKFNGSAYAAKVPENVGGGRMALFAVIHQIHCVHTLWQTAYPEYYSQHYRQSQENREEWLEHIDHCADMLRQKLMCDADPTLITYNWLKHHRVPHPNFNTQHKCRNYDLLLDQVHNWMLDGSQLDDGKVLRPTDRVVEFEGEPPFEPHVEA